MPNSRKIKRSRTKTEIRSEIQREVEQYLASGGEVQKIPSGISGNENKSHLFSQPAGFEPKKERTSVTDVVKTLDARKKAKHLLIKRKTGPRKKLLTDDFGEPIRWVWEEG